jgi:hypothetical protein
MTKSPSSDTAVRIFVDAILTNSRMIKEQATSLPSRFTSAPNQLQVRTETSSEFRVGLDNPEAPKDLLIEVDYKVQLLSQEGDKQLASYEATHVGQFMISSWGGFTDWAEVPTDTFSSYFAVLHHIALSRAENTLGALGLKGGLPRHNDIGSASAKIGQNVSTAEEPAKA